MKFKSYCAMDEQYTNECFRLIEMMNGEEVAKELGITRSAVYRFTKKAIGKIYKALESSGESTPVEIVMTIIQYLQAEGDGTFDQVAKDVVRSLDAGQKKAFADDLKKRFPGLDASKFGV